jgi:multidrug resistance efflux pump
MSTVAPPVAATPPAAAPQAAAAAQPTPPVWTPPHKSPLVILLGAVLIACGVLAILYGWRLWPFAGGAQRTENAYVRGRVTVISPQVSGYVTEVAAQDYDDVPAGHVLVRIDDRIYRQRVDQAQAALKAQIAALDNSEQSERSRDAALASLEAGVANAQAQLLRAEADMRRVRDLVTDGSVSQREADQTLAALRQAQAAVRQAEASRRIGREDIRTVQVGREGLRANVDAARATLRQAEIDLEHTVIRAPEGGRLNEIGVRLGQYVTNGSQLMYLVPSSIWVIANYKEAQTERMVPGARARFSVDALGGRTIRGHVERLSPAAGSEFAVLKPDNATGNFTKIPQRIGVRISIDRGQPLAARLRPGMSVVASVDTSGVR